MIKLGRILESELEGHYAPLYHFTDFVSVVQIAFLQTLKTGSDRDQISFTRDKRYPAKGVVPADHVRLDFDKERLVQNYSVEPYRNLQHPKGQKPRIGKWESEEVVKTDKIKGVDKYVYNIVINEYRYEKWLKWGFKPRNRFPVGELEDPSVDPWDVFQPKGINSAEDLVEYVSERLDATVEFVDSFG